MPLVTSFYWVQVQCSIRHCSWYVELTSKSGELVISQKLQTTDCASSRPYNYFSKREHARIGQFEFSSYLLIFTFMQLYLDHSDRCKMLFRHPLLTTVCTAISETATKPQLLTLSVSSPSNPTTYDEHRRSPEKARPTDRHVILSWLTPL